MSQRTYTKVIAVGGVAERISSSWDEEREWGKAFNRAAVQLARELLIGGYLRMTDMPRDGSYRKRWLELTVCTPDVPRTPENSPHGAHGAHENPA